jgi:hypothetical protein
MISSHLISYHSLVIAAMGAVAGAPPATRCMLTRFLFFMLVVANHARDGLVGRDLRHCGGERGCWSRDLAGGGQDVGLLHAIESGFWRCRGRKGKVKWLQRWSGMGKGKCSSHQNRVGSRGHIRFGAQTCKSEVPRGGFDGALKSV